MRFRRNVRGLLLPVALLCCAPATLGASDDSDRAIAFDGLGRAELVALLGEPHKTKLSDGQETLTYTLHAVSDDYVPASNERVIDVPGRGACRIVLRHGERVDPGVAIGPTTFDDRGRPVPGGATTTQSHTATYGNGDRAAKEPRSSGTVGARAKLKLHLVDGHVAMWSVAP